MGGTEEEAKKTKKLANHILQRWRIIVIFSWIYVYKCTDWDGFVFFFETRSLTRHRKKIKWKKNFPNTRLSFQFVGFLFFMCLTCQAYWARVGVTHWTWRLSNDGWTRVWLRLPTRLLALLTTWTAHRQGTTSEPGGKRDDTQNEKKNRSWRHQVSATINIARICVDRMETIYISRERVGVQRVGRWRCDSIEQHRKSKSNASSRENGLNVRRVAFTSPHSYQCGIETVVYSIKKKNNVPSLQFNVFGVSCARHPPATPTIFWVIFTIYLFFPPETQLSWWCENVKIRRDFSIQTRTCFFCEWRRKKCSRTKLSTEWKKIPQNSSCWLFFLVRVNIKKT